MNILIIVHNLTGGGAERVAASWANGLSARGHNVVVLSDFSQPVTYQLSSKVTQEQIPTGVGVGKIKALTRILSYPFILRRILRRYSIDAVINVLYFRPQITDFVCKTIRRRPRHIMTDHNVFQRPEYAPMHKGDAHLKFDLGPRFDLLTVLTDIDRDYLRSIGFKNVETLHNPLFLQPVDSVPHKDKIVLAVGRIDAYVKGFDLLVQAWNYVVAAHPDWRLRIVGNGSETAKQKLLSLSTNPATVELVPYTDSVEAEYQRASIFVLSSRYEGWGLVLVEAMSQGCASLACDFGGRQAEIITDGIDGLLCEPNSVKAIADGIERLISNDDLRHRLQETAPASTARFSEDLTAQRLEHLITSLNK